MHSTVNLMAQSLPEQHHYNRQCNAPETLTGSLTTGSASWAVAPRPLPLLPPPLTACMPCTCSVMWVGSKCHNATSQHELSNVHCAMKLALHGRTTAVFNACDLDL
jgi:hypothetical protein